MRSYYLVDYENVGADYIKAFLETYTTKDIYDDYEKDQFVIFYSERCPNIPMNLLESLYKKGLDVQCKMAIVGTKNALDFQLSSYLGYMIGAGYAVDKIYLVSNDKGYDCLCDFWDLSECTIERIAIEKPIKKKTTTVKQTTEKKDTKPKQSAKTATSDNLDKDNTNTDNTATLAEIKQYLSKSDNPEAVLKIFNQYKSKQAICNGMTKKFKDSKKAGAIYKKLKPLLKEKGKS